MEFACRRGREIVFLHPAERWSVGGKRVINAVESRYLYARGREELVCGSNFYHTRLALHLLVFGVFKSCCFPIPIPDIVPVQIEVNFVCGYCCFYLESLPLGSV